MFRIFKKQHDLAARNTEARARRPRRQHLAIEALEGRQLLSLGTTVFPVNTNTAGSQFESDSASSALGGSVVVWTTDGINGSSQHDIHAQLFNQDGSKHGGEIVVNQIHKEERLPKVAMDAVGNFVVVWQENVGFGTEIWGRRFDFNGHAPSTFSQFEVASNFPHDHNPDVAMDSNGNFVVSYTEDFSSNDIDVRAMLFKNDGTKKTIDVARSSIADETGSSVAMSGDGRFDVAYNFQIHGASDHDIIMSQYNAGGTLMTNGTHVISNTGADEVNPSVAMDNAGNGVVVYQKFVGTDFDIKAKRVSSGGAVGSEIFVQQTFAQERIPSVTLSPTGGAFVVGYNTDLLGAPPHTNTTVEVSEVNASDTVVGRLNLPAVPNNTGAALSIDQFGQYQLSYTSGVGGDQNISMQLGQLPTAPAAQNLKLTTPITVGHSATLSGQLVDGDGDTNLTLTVNWGDGSKVQQSHPGTKPFKLKHKYAQPGTYTVHATWTDSTGLSNSRDLSLVVNPHHIPVGPPGAGTPSGLTVRSGGQPEAAARARFPAAAALRGLRPSGDAAVSGGGPNRDGSTPWTSTPDRKPFRLKHKYTTAGSCTVRVIWTESTRQSRFCDLTVAVTAPKE